MPLTPGTRLGPYEILAPIGAGGMGEVYRARDTRLNRDVAVKVLPAHLSQHAEIRARFDREAKAISSLNHPHICTLHDIGQEGGVDYLVMELIEGELLADRTAKGPVPLPELLLIGAQIADALDKAHRKGLVHRDLKPGNIMLTKSGAKLLDFGLARSTGPGVAGDLSSSPTMARSLTTEGAIVGTFQYMSPEQLEGQEADARSDIWALGATLYEMATGRRAFSGRTQASLITSIMRDEPRPIADLAPLSPPGLDRLVAVCLSKDPDDRFQTARDLKRQLEWIRESPSQAGARATVAPAKAPAGARLAWAVAVLATIAALGFAARALLRKPETSQRIVSAIEPATDAPFVVESGPMALSPDGRLLAYVARDADGKNLLWIRPLDDEAPRSLPGTDDASCPFWSPDGKSVAFFTRGALKRIDIDGGQPETLGTARRCYGGTWGPDGTILFSPDYQGSINRLNTRGEGSEPAAPVEVPGYNVGVVWPSFLPDGRHFLYTIASREANSSNAGIYVGSLDSEERRRLIPVLSNARYVPPGYLVYAKDGVLRAQAFDAGRLEVSGEPFVLAKDVQFMPGIVSHLFSVSGNGLLAYVRGVAAQNTQYCWFDRSGTRLGALGSPGLLYSPRISHDGQRLTYDQSDPVNDSGDIWNLDLRKGVADKLTYEAANESGPQWSPDDSRIMYFKNNGAAADIMLTASNGTGTSEVLFSNGARNLANDWSRSGRFALFNVFPSDSLATPDLWVYSFETRKASPWLATPFRETSARFSPDERWIAYVSDESGRREIYVRSLATTGGKWRVSVDGGSMPVWRADGRELFFVSLSQKMMSVAVRPGDSFDADPPKPLFSTMSMQIVVSDIAQYDVTADGQRFVMIQSAALASRPVITLVSNWHSGLTKR